MIALIQADLIPIAASFLIGLVTARWTFRRTAQQSRGPIEK